MLQKAPDVTVSSVLRPEQVPAVMEFMKTTGVGLSAGLRADDGEGGDGGGSRGRSAAEEEEEGEGTDDEGDSEWRFGLFE
jgi:ribosomal protein L12E/L44/L45/RPP1/RPP2